METEAKARDPLEWWRNDPSDDVELIAALADEVEQLRPALREALDMLNRIAESEPSAASSFTSEDIERIAALRKLLP
jgi:hypothetical protein